MDYSPTSPLLSLLLAELLFGLLYAAVVHWLSTQHYFPGGTAGSVIVGDAATLFIQWLFVRASWDPSVTFACFACSGAPMALTYWFRHHQRVEKAKHCRRPWPTAALRVRDDAVMDITRMIQEIEIAAKKEMVTAGFLIGVVNELHAVKKTLTSV